MSEDDTSGAVISQATPDHLDTLYGLAMVLTHDQSKAEDLVQETYLRAVRAQDQLRPGSNLKGWLFTIIRNIWLNQIAPRAQRRVAYRTGCGSRGLP